MVVARRLTVLSPLLLSLFNIRETRAHILHLLFTVCLLTEIRAITTLF